MTLQSNVAFDILGLSFGHLSLSLRIPIAASLQSSIGTAEKRLQERTIGTGIAKSKSGIKPQAYQPKWQSYKIFEKAHKYY